MIKFVLIGLWIAVVTLASTYAGAMYLGHALAPSQEGVDAPDIEHVETKPITVPIIARGAIQGYVVAKLGFTIATDVSKSLAVQPDVFIVDEAFKVIYGGVAFDFRDAKKDDLGALSVRIKDNINTRFGKPLVHDVLFEELSYVPNDQTRGGKPRGSGTKPAPPPSTAEAPPAKSDGHGGGH